MRLFSKPVVIFAGLVILLGGWWLVSRRPDNAVRRESPQSFVTVRTALAEIRQIDSIRTLPGVTEAQFNATLSTKTPGRVERVLVTPGDVVKKGQPLVYLERAEVEAALQMAEAAVKSAQRSYEVSLLAAEIEGKTVPEREQQAAAALGAAKAQLQILRTGSRAQEIEVAKQQLAAAEADYDLSQRDYNRYNELYNQGVVSKQQRDVQQSRLDTAKARVLAARSVLSLAVEGPRSEDIQAAEERLRQAEAALREAKAGRLQVASRRKAAALALEQKRQAEAAARAASAALAQTVIRAPFDGVVAERFVDAGDMAIPGAPLLEIFGGEIRLVVSGPEDTLGVLRKGSTVQWAISGQGKLEGARVAEVLPAADPTTHTVVVKLSLPKQVPPGLAGEAEVVLGRRKAVTLPKEAVVGRDGVEYVFIASDNGTAELRIIQSTPISANLLEALSGLSGGERIVIDPPPSLADGMRLKLRKGSP